MIIQKEIRNLINTLALKIDLPFDTIREVFWSQFEYTKKELEKGEKGDFDSYKNIMLRYFGTFHTKKEKLDKLEEMINNKKNGK